jgi:hypothetical protein
MSVIVVIGAGPRPNAAVYSMTATSPDTSETAQTKYVIMDGNEFLGSFEKQSYAECILSLIKRGE